MIINYLSNKCLGMGIVGSHTFVPILGLFGSEKSDSSIHHMFLPKTLDY